MIRQKLLIDAQKANPSLLCSKQSMQPACRPADVQELESLASTDASVALRVRARAEDGHVFLLRFAPLGARSVLGRALPGRQWSLMQELVSRSSHL